MSPVWFLILHMPFLRAQVTPELPSGVTVEALNSTDLPTNSTNSSTDPSWFGGTPSEAPTEPEDDWTPAETFLYTGDPSTLKTGRCTRAYSTAGQTGALPGNFNGPLQPALDALANAANFLNMIFQASDLRESTVQEDMEWYHALVRALLEADALVQRALLTFDADPTAPAPQLVLRASRDPAARPRAIVLQDLSRAWDALHPPAPAPDDGWFRRWKFPGPDQRAAALSKRVLFNDLNTLDTPKWGQGDSYVTNRSGVHWASAPYLDCKDGRFVPGWVLTLSTSFYGLKPDLTPEFRGVIRVDVNIQDIDLDQCMPGDNWFADTHQCNRTTMEVGQWEKILPQYCKCTFQAEAFGSVSTAAAVNKDITILRYPLRTWRIRASGLLLLEMILFGSLLLYFPVFILYFKPSTFRCILLRWVRMLGFSIVYGTITLKMYRVLKVFLSRTAQRVPYMSSLHLLRILGVMLMTASWFLCAWTVGVLQNRDRNIPVFVTATTSDGQDFSLCYVDRWDYMMAVAELLFLCWGSSLWTAVRPVPSAFHEPRYMGIAIHNELLLSSMFHLFRFTFQSLHPDWMLLLSFLHTHVTITVTLALLFVPKFLHVQKPRREEIAAEVYEDEVDLRRTGSCLNNSFRSAWSERSVEPDDFRDELKKLYTQLEVHKTKKMSANNPHLPKKRSSRCSLGRSIMKRIVDIPETVSRRCSRDDRDGSFRSKCGSHSDSFRIVPDTFSINYRSSIRSPSIRKSQSDHHYSRERDSSQRDSTLRANSVKRASQRSETDSLDIPPGVCKSASAQNLTIDTNLLHPDHTRLHKSWSLSSSTTHSIENIAKISRASSMRSRQSMSISDQTRSALQSESFDKAEVCPWEVGPEQSGEKNNKHVTYANSEDGEDKRPASPQALICPWDHLPPVESKPTEEKEPHGDIGITKTPVTVSASAPGSPRPMVMKDQRVFSFRNTTNTKWLSVKSFMGSVDANSKSSKDVVLNREDSQKSQESTSTTPRSGTSSRRPSMDRRSLQKMSMSTTDGKPGLVKQTAVRLSSGDSSDRSPRRLVIMKSSGYTGDADDLQKDGLFDGVFLSRQSSKRSSISSWDNASNSRTPSTRRRGSNRIRPASNVSPSEAYPWDGSGPNQQGEGPKKQQSIKVDVSHQESQVSERSNVCPWESHEQGSSPGQESGLSEVCPWESKDILKTSQTALSKDLQTQPSLKHVTEVCPWETVETPKISIRQDSEHSNVCPWDIQGKAEGVYENINPSENKGTLTVPLRQEAIRSAVYPGTSIEVKSNNQPDSSRSPAKNRAEQVSRTTEGCPLDFPVTPKVKEDVCSLEGGRKESPNTYSQMTIKVDICPWETEKDTADDSGKGPSPIKAASIQTEVTEKTKVNVCPWETDSSEKTADTNIPQALKTPLNVCPWETDEPKVLNQQDSPRADVCPWDSDEPKVLKKQDSTRADVCPWDSGEPKESTRADVCPWDTEDTNAANKQDGIGEVSCPIEGGEPGVAGNNESSGDDRVYISYCDIDDTANQGVLGVEENSADISSEQTDESKANLALGRRDALCPWDTERSMCGSFTDSTSDVFTWEPENIPEEDEDDDAECAAEALVFPPDL
ncbi:unnamed protein product [Menidia menidia]|uniref:(Atlantic silverside) hypothetical protein n=1 Tax=Menidia menidia TaxID=238744 RepID=A0A8S4BAS4_9TELE|nr:unnamed protein product [Menidia menidia]